MLDVRRLSESRFLLDFSPKTSSLEENCSLDDSLHTQSSGQFDASGTPLSNDVSLDLVSYALLVFQVLQLVPRRHYGSSF